MILNIIIHNPLQKINPNGDAKWGRSPKYQPFEWKRSPEATP